MKESTLNIRMEPELVQALDAWRADQPMADAGRGSAIRFAIRRLLTEAGYLEPQPRRNRSMREVRT